MGILSDIKIICPFVFNIRSARIHYIHFLQQNYSDVLIEKKNSRPRIQPYHIFPADFSVVFSGYLKVRYYAVNSATSPSHRPHANVGGNGVIAPFPFRLSSL